MLSDFEKSIITLVKAGVTNTCGVMEKTVLTPEILKISKSHAVSGILYSGASRLGVSAADPLMKTLFSFAGAELLHQTKLFSVIENVCEKFKSHGIDFMLLKGGVLRNLYPSPEMRVLSDGDILIRKEQFSDAKKIMLESGFSFALESDHEYIFINSQKQMIELHKRLIPSYNKSYYAYFGEGFAKAVKQNGSEYTLKNEDCFIFAFTHFAKHYRDGGVGIKHFCDLWLLLSIPNLNIDYIEKELKKLSLITFYKNIRKTLSFWFDGKEGTDVSKLITKVIIKSGSFGTKEDKTVAAAYRAQSERSSKNARFAFFIKKAFPSAASLESQYGFLKKMKFLLPLVWILRIFKKQKKIPQSFKEIHTVSGKRVSDYEKALKAVGLDFKFKE